MHSLSILKVVWRFRVPLVCSGVSSAINYPIFVFFFKFTSTKIEKAHVRSEKKTGPAEFSFTWYMYWLKGNLLLPVHVQIGEYILPQFRERSVKYFCRFSTPYHINFSILDQLWMSSAAQHENTNFEFSSCRKWPGEVLLRSSVLLVLRRVRSGRAIFLIFLENLIWWTNDLMEYAFTEVLRSNFHVQFRRELLSSWIYHNQLQLCSDNYLGESCMASWSLIILW